MPEAKGPQAVSDAWNMEDRPARQEVASVAAGPRPRPSGGVWGEYPAAKIGGDGSRQGPKLS